MSIVTQVIKSEWFTRIKNGDNFTDLPLDTTKNIVGSIFEDVKVRLRDLREKAIRRALGSPTEAALLVLAEKAGYYIYDLQKRYEIITEFSFSSESKRMTSIYKPTMGNPDSLVFSKGAPERIINISSQIEINYFSLSYWLLKQLLLLLLLYIVGSFLQLELLVEVLQVVNLYQS